LKNEGILGVAPYWVAKTREN